MEVGSFLLSLVSVGLAFWALYKAKSAYEMAKTVIGRKNVTEDSQRLRDLIATLNAAKDAAIRWEGGANSDRSIGRDPQQDIDLLQKAQDALKTKLPVSWDHDQRTPANEAADEIETALDGIKTTDTDRDGWKDARATIQTILPHLEQEERQLVNRTLIPIRF